MRSVAACLTVLLAVGVALVAFGCGNQDDSTPVACLEGATAYEKALQAAPGEVLLQGKTAISDCLAANQKAGDLSRVGEATVAAATALNAQARDEDGGDAALQLGYLIGAVARGAETSEGIHSDLVRRLTVAARYAPGDQPLSRQFLSAYREGFDAGHSGG